MRGNENTRLGTAAVLEDRTSRTREQIEFIGTPAGRLFVSVAAPLDDGPLAAAVICPPLFTDTIANYRREVALARHATEYGLAVARFHYHGAGHSDGADTDIDFHGMVRDVKAVAESLVARFGQLSVGFVGSRLGAFAAAGADVGERVLLLWEPTLDPLQYLREMFRVRFLRSLALRQPERVTSEHLFNELANGRDIDALGYRLTASLYRDLAGISLRNSLANCSGTALLVGFEEDPVRVAELSSLARQLRSWAWEAEIEVVATEANWWLLGAQTPTPRKLIELSAKWLAHRLVGSAG